MCKAGFVFRPKKEHASHHIKSKIAVTVSHHVSISDDKVRTIQNLMLDTNKHYVIVDGGADTGLKGGLTSLIFEHTSRKVSITGFNDEMVQKCLPIGTNATKVVNSNGKVVILIKNEQIDDTGQNNSVLSVNQMRAFGVGVDDCPGLHSHDGIQGRQSMIFNYISSLIGI